MAQMFKMFNGAFQGQVLKSIYIAKLITRLTVRFSNRSIKVIYLVWIYSKGNLSNPYEV